ncbi:STAS domain-containing protein [Terrimonas sp. NA20]|uniref:STAS domain-containing protein n=1 Tax=Terrimonas ginsenosidimutans TaxID=2908004 RepID=A0ABS9KPN0_9BACT|nr:STAS domain-containing protein [Terrimonas ginsenosidimutans]MCG2614259.1 STAS domain-containing protein [Terrimonas ginsenosidimutans]
MAAKITVYQALNKNAKKLHEDWLTQQMQDEGLREDLISNEELRLESEEFLKTFLAAIKDDLLEDSNSSNFDKLNEMLAGISINRARHGFSPRETGYYIFSLKQAIFKTLEKEITDLKKLYTEILRVNKLIDSLATVTFETFIRGREEVIIRQTNEISDISTPVIQVWDNILALPIIGTLDSSRTQVVMESLLMKIVETESTIAILDISGVPAVDSLVAQHLIKTVSATRLMGAECIISGIRPEIAQTIVHLGIDLSGINTKASLSHALRFAFQTLRLEVRKKTDKTAS